MASLRSSSCSSGRARLQGGRAVGVEVLVLVVVHADGVVRPAPNRQGRHPSQDDSHPLYGRHNRDMPTSPHRPAPAPRKLSGADAEDLALYQEKFRGRLPESLEELHGPAKGVVELPLHMAWSGMTTYDLDKPRQRMGLYRTILHEGLREDLPRYLNRDLLLELWPVLRTLVGRTVRTVWEDAFPQLSSRTRAAA